MWEWRRYIRPWLSHCWSSCLHGRYPSQLLNCFLQFLKTLMFESIKIRKNPFFILVCSLLLILYLPISSYHNGTTCFSFLISLLSFLILQFLIFQFTFLIFSTKSEWQHNWIHNTYFVIHNTDYSHSSVHSLKVKNFYHHLFHCIISNHLFSNYTASYFVNSLALSLFNHSPTNLPTHSNMYKQKFQIVLCLKSPSLYDFYT